MNKGSKVENVMWQWWNALVWWECSKILSLSVSYFTSLYVMKWKEFFPGKELKAPPSFDGRVICYPRAKIIQDYLAWRQVDCKCHIIECFLIPRTWNACPCIHICTYTWKACFANQNNLYSLIWYHYCKQISENSMYHITKT